METKARRRELVLFDFDGTLTYGDTLIPFLRSAVGAGRLRRALLAVMPLLAVARLKGRRHRNMRRSAAKERLFGICFKGMPYTEFVEKGRCFGRIHGGELLNPAMVEKLLAALGRQDAEAVVVSASMEEWIAPVLADVCGTKMPEIISTRPEVDGEGRLTGRFARPNCNGIYKCVYLEEKYGGRPDAAITAYGDSEGDREMLAWADNGVKLPGRKAGGKVRGMLNLLKYVK